MAQGIDRVLFKKKYNFSSERSPGRNEEVKHDVTGAV
jgi:hypothetical protein